ncbi:hypothetical protein THZG08_10101 [Vibrio owensii]|nr:hypothetical protein THZG08_10101 [Vibrio owensii]CAH1548523.1 hypothetical protein THOA03_10101 [Vibrio owensii]
MSRLSWRQIELRMPYGITPPYKVVLIITIKFINKPYISRLFHVFFDKRHAIKISYISKLGNIYEEARIWAFAAYCCICAIFACFSFRFADFTRHLAL